MQSQKLKCVYSRRRFLSCCTACAGCLASGVLVAQQKPAVEGTSSEKPKIRLVFCETSNDKPIWPNIGYDFETRRQQLLDLLSTGCQDLLFLPMQLMDHPEDADKVLAMDSEVDGYVVCVQGLGWQNDIVKLCSTGKPTLLVDNLFGGSGLFLTRQKHIMSSGQPVDWASSSNDNDIVASVRHFNLLREGKSAAEVAAAFRRTRRKNTAAKSALTFSDDLFEVTSLDEALTSLSNMKILVVGGGWGGDEFRAAAQKTLGVQFIPLPFEDLAAAYKQADVEQSVNFAAKWTSNAQRVVEPTGEEIIKSGAMYVAMKQLIDAHQAVGISINCLGGFYGGHLEAYPCLGFSQLNNDGKIGGCEADQMSALTMATISALTGRASFISDPVIDTAKNEIIYAHCVAMTKPFGKSGMSNPYLIRNHSEDRLGACVQSLLPEGYLVTTLEINPVSRQVLVHQAVTSGNSDSDLACRTKLRAVVQGDIEKLTENWTMGWHRVTVYGDVRSPITELCERLNFELIIEA
ncbi:hypothetical protein EH223_14055 [candidate division KSB1 bacterium]|nr:hypothetical protein [candidate division KSB1 bacterium]RQW01814.1 MAG: hypothetical protein EH223_14055 [candidate division KSB1 bacterium]